MAKWNITVFEPKLESEGETARYYPECGELRIQRGTGIRFFIDREGVKHLFTGKFHAVRIPGTERKTLLQAALKCASEVQG